MSYTGNKSSLYLVVSLEEAPPLFAGARASDYRRKVSLLVV